MPNNKISDRHTSEETVSQLVFLSFRPQGEISKLSYFSILRFLASARNDHFCNYDTAFSRHDEKDFIADVIETACVYSQSIFLNSSRREFGGISFQSVSSLVLLCSTPP